MHDHIGTLASCDAIFPARDVSDSNTGAADAIDTNDFMSGIEQLEFDGRAYKAASPGN
jgi:hypothetical protein